MNELRPYQRDMLEAARQAYREGYHRPCLVLGCGGGKSVIVAEMARAATQRGRRVLFLVHRQELCDQIRATFGAWGVRMSLCDVMMVQTATRRIDRLKTPGLIITDENHHALAASYRRIYDAFPDVPGIGVTATPVRLNGEGLHDVNDRLILGPSTRWMIDHGYLADYDYYAPDVADLTHLHTNRGEFRADEASRALNLDTIHGDVIRHWRRLAEGRQTICYCSGIEHSRDTAAAFTAAGIPAAHIDGTTPEAERRRAVEEFRRGELRVLCNVDLISEGFDVPDCSCAVLLRPTKSLTLYIQQSMRPMRFKPGKRAVILDHVGNYARHGLPDAEREWSLEGKPRHGREKTDPDAVGVRQCPRCFRVFSPAPVCPYCGYRFPLSRRELEERRETQLQRIQGFVLEYSGPEQCRSYRELLIYAKQHGYKPGWAFYQSKRRGFLTS